MITSAHEGDSINSVIFNVYSFTKLLFQAFKNDGRIDEILSNCIVWTIPVINLDSYT